MSIQKQTATVYYAPTRGRRYFNRVNAIRGEAIALILKKHPPEPYEHDTGGGWNIRVDEPERFETMVRRMCRLIKISMKR